MAAGKAGAAGLVRHDQQVVGRARAIDEELDEVVEAGGDEGSEEEESLQAEVAEGEGGGFEDLVKMTVTEVGTDGRRNLSFEYLSGDRQRPFTKIEGFRGNPLIMLFLQHDVEEMQKATGGASVYFRNRIRHAFRSGAEVGESTVEIGGQALGATLVTIRPFVKDPKLARFPYLAEKWYEFVLAPGVPGGLYRIRSVVPSASGGAPPIENSLTYAGT